MTEDAQPKRRRPTPHDDFAVWRGEVLTLLQGVLEAIQETNRQMAAKEETRKKLSLAGTKSVAARVAKFGSSRPPQNGRSPKTIIVDDPIPEPPSNLVQECSAGKVIQMQPEIPGFAEPSSNQVHEIESKPKRAKRLPSGPPPGSLVWDEYSAAFQRRHGVQPIRDARANRHCADLVKRVGPQRANELARYYISRSDVQYIKSKHPLGILLLDVQKLNTEMQTGQVMTHRDAQRAETSAANDSAIHAYLRSQESTEGARE